MSERRRQFVVVGGSTVKERSPLQFRLWSLITTFCGIRVVSHRGCQYAQSVVQQIAYPFTAEAQTALFKDPVRTAL